LAAPDSHVYRAARCIYVNSVHRFVVIALLILSGILPASAKKKHSPKATPTKAETEAATRLQVFLDRANFCPGKIDGRYNEFTWKALALYRQSRGEQSLAPPLDNAKSNVALDLSGLDLASVDPVFIPYAVTETDLQSVGRLPSGVTEKAKVKFLPYPNAADAIAEKFHSDVHFLEHLNPDKLKKIKPGDQLMVPNVEPFEVTSVKDIQPGSETASQPANEVEDRPETQAPTPGESGAPRNVAIKIDTKTNMLGVFEGEKVIAAYPVTVGSAHTASPIGEWKVLRIAKLPTFRWDKEMLRHGKRGGNFYLLPLGPRNPVGVMWIALNKKGIGIHGTNDPGSIGHAVSHGCIRLANWDVVRLATKIKPGDNVSIH
jgi:lipoprotein-anchoring transpeptidase ErfK/SrfK